MNHPVFTPSAADPAELDSMTVGRTELFATLVQRIRGAARDGSRPHTLLVAPRGGGKTHTLHVTVHRSLADPATAEAILPVWIPEDALAVGTYADLLVEIARAIDPELAIIARSHRLDKDVVAIERSILTAADGRMILLTIENLDRVFESIGPAGQGSLRAWVETSSSITIFATVPLLFAGISSRSFPWYGSFMVEHLPELTADEGAVILAQAARGHGDGNLAEFVASSAGHDRLRVIHRLAGGSPRLWHILSDCVDVTSLDDLVPAVESLLDRLAPYYQHRLWQLPAGERRLVVELARGWAPRTVGDLAAAVGVSNQSAATALGRLTSSRWVRSGKADSGDKRASWYDLTEPLLRYHLQYREDHVKPLRLIVEFLSAFYTFERLMVEPPTAGADSSAERPLRLAIGELLCHTMNFDHAETSWLSTLRIWIADADPEVSRVATALEPVVCAAFGRTADRREPSGLRRLVDRAVGAAGSGDTPIERMRAGVDVLAEYDWAPAARDVIDLIRFEWLADSPPATAAVLRRAPGNTRTSAPAVRLRMLAALRQREFGGDRGAETALHELDRLLDDLEERGLSPASPYAPLALTFLTETVVGLHRHGFTGESLSPPRYSRRLGLGFVFALEAKALAWPDLAVLMAAVEPDAREIAVAIAAAAVVRPVAAAPAEFDPLRYLDAESRAAVEHFAAAMRNTGEV